MNSEDPSFQIDPIGTEVESRLDKERLYAIIQELPSPQREVIELYYGLSVNSDDEMSNADIAEKLRLSKEQVRQYRKEGLAALKTRLTPALSSNS
jgi:RNA polymerase sigma factor (sigma-70 family)